MKKIAKLFAGAVLLAAVVGLTGCDGLFGNDPDKTIGGVGDNKKTVNAENDDTDLKRVYVPTTWNHYGAKVKITMDKESKGVMGVIFDLQESTAGVKKDDGKTPAENFFIVAVNAGQEANMRPYVSKLVNVKDLEADNFGALKSAGNVIGTIGGAGDILTTTNTKEKEIVELGEISKPKTDFEDGDNYVFCIEVFPCDKFGTRLYTGGNGNKLYTEEPADGGAADSTKEYKDEVGFRVKIYPKSFDGTAIVDEKIGADLTGYNNGDKDKSSKQNKLGFYYNIIAKKNASDPANKMKGEWKVEDFYALAEIDE